MSTTASSSRDSSPMGRRWEPEEQESFFANLRDINWKDGAKQGLNFVSQNQDSLESKQEDGSTVIQTLLELADVPQDPVDEVVMNIIDLSNLEYLNITGRGRETALYTAVRRERPAVARKLLEKGADVTIRNHQDRVPIHAAAINGDAALIESLLENHPALINDQDAEKLTPLDAACWQGNIEVVNFILARDKGSLKLTDKSGMTPLMTAVDHGRLDCCQALLELEEGMALLNLGDDGAVTALDTSCIKGHIDIVKLLLDKGADKECRDAKGFTPLLTAASNNHADIVEELIERGSVVTAQTNEGDTAMIRAAFYGHIEIVKLLLRHDSCKELIDMTDNGGVTPLILASRHGWTDVIITLLDAGADQMKYDQYGNTALMGASKWRYASVVEVLLNHAKTLPDDGLNKIINHKSIDEAALTALHNACYNGHMKVIELLLDNGVDVDVVDSQKLNALHYACRQGYKEMVEVIFKRTTNINAVDEDGWSALHHAACTEYDKAKQLAEADLGPEPDITTGGIVPVPGKHVEILQYLLVRGVDPQLLTTDDETALHMASSKGFHSRVEVLLQNGKVNETLSWQNKNGRTPLGIAMERERPHVVRQLLEKLQTADFGEEEDKEQLMVWLAKRKETHDEVRILLSKDNAVQRHTHLTISEHWSALEWAAYRAYPKLLWWLLYSSVPSPGRDMRIKAAERIAKSFVNDRTEKNRGAKFDTEGKGAKPSKDKHDDGDGDGGGKDNLSLLGEPNNHYRQILQILRNPPMTQTAGAAQQLKQLSDKPMYMPHSVEMVDHYSACVMEFYDFDKHSGFLRRFDTVKDVIYVRGPDEIMREAREKTHRLDAQFGPEDGIAASSWTAKDVKVRWVHLPANNMKWMSDLALTMSGSSEIDGSGLAWLDQSWDQVMGKNRSSRFMKPKCVNRMNGSRHVTQAALYMPYLTLAMHRERWTKHQETYEALIKDYDSNIIHGSRTLDEFYYHSCEDQNLRLDIINRNQDQVLSKTIHGLMGDLESWILLNVDQVWIWVVDHRTIITSSTHRKDGVEDPLITAVLDNLGHANDTGVGRGAPDTAFQMARLIVDTCVGFYEREFRMKLEGQYDGRLNWKGSVQDVFTNAIAQAALREAVLYGDFATDERRTKRSDYSRLVRQSHGKRREILEAANLFREIKDIRDELKMLKTVAEHQATVQRGLPRPISANGAKSRGGGVSSEGIANGLREMDKAAARIETAVNTTLTLEQNEISISQAQEAVSQGRTLMLFTVVTILFLPLSFFTSFFALDVASFLKTPPWAFIVLFCISFGIFTPLAGYAFFSEQITSYWYSLRAMLTPSPDSSINDDGLYNPAGSIYARESQTNLRHAPYSWGTEMSGLSQTNLPRLSMGNNSGLEKEKEKANGNATGGPRIPPLTKRARTRTFYDEEKGPPAKEGI